MYDFVWAAFFAAQNTSSDVFPPREEEDPELLRVV